MAGVECGPLAKAMVYLLYIASERANVLLDVGLPIPSHGSTIGRSTSQSELGSGLWGQFKVSTDRDGGGEFDGIAYMSVIALQEKVSGSCFRHSFHRTLTVGLAALGSYPKLQRFRAFHVQAGSQMEKTYSFSFPGSRIFLAIPFHYCRLKGNLSRIEVECEYVCFQELIPNVDAY